jgi:hypothetical protein
MTQQLVFIFTISAITDLNLMKAINSFGRHSRNISFREGTGRKKKDKHI